MFFITTKRVMVKFQDCMQCWGNKKKDSGTMHKNRQSMVSCRDQGLSFLCIVIEHKCRKSTIMLILKYLNSYFQIDDIKFKIPRKGKAKIVFALTVPYVGKTVEIDGNMEVASPLEVHSVLQPGITGCKDSIGVDTCIVFISAFPYIERKKYESDLWKEPHVINIYHKDTDRYETDQTHMMQLKTMKAGDDFWNDISQGDITVNKIIYLYNLVNNYFLFFSF